MALRSLAFAVCCTLAAGRLSSVREWKPAAKALQELNAVEQALRKVEGSKLSPEQKKAASRTVQDVDQVLADLKSNKKLTTEQKKAKVKSVIEELQGLQSQWELSSVEEALKKVVDTPHLSAKQRAAAKKVVAEVDSVVEEIQSGKLKDKAAQNKKVAVAIKELQGLQREWVNSTASSHIAQLEQQLAEKKALLAKDEKELKLAGLEKDLIEKKAELQHLVEEKKQAETQQKDRQQEAAQQAMVGQLLATAKSLVSAKKAAEAPAKPAEQQRRQEDAGAAAKQAAIQSVLGSLKAQAANVSKSITRMDAEEKKREEELETSMKAPTTGKKDAIAKGQAILKMLVKRTRRSYQKARAAREAQLQELNDGIRNVQKGDVQALTRLMSKMETESKSMQAKSKNFLY